VLHKTYTQAYTLTTNLWTASRIKTLAGYYIYKSFTYLLIQSVTYLTTDTRKTVSVVNVKLDINGSAGDLRPTGCRKETDKL